MKRFWREVTVDAAGRGVLLDGRPLRTPLKAPLVLPTAALAAAVAAEWADQGAEVRPDTMPLTRAANTTIDRVAAAREQVAAAVAAYGGADLTCYRAPHPRGLVAAQAAAWDPVLDWAAARFGARLRVTVGVMPQPQDPRALAALAAAVAAYDPWALTALHDLVTLSGSLLLGLAVAEGWLDVADAWTRSRLDEDWQIAEWGEDTEAAAAATRRATDFAQAARLLSLLRAP